MTEQEYYLSLLDKFVKLGFKGKLLYALADAEFARWKSSLQEKLLEEHLPELTVTAPKVTMATVDNSDNTSLRAGSKDTDLSPETKRALANGVSYDQQQALKYERDALKAASAVGAGIMAGVSPVIIGSAVPAVVSAASSIAPGTSGGYAVGNMAKDMLIYEGLNHGFKAVSGITPGELVRNYLDYLSGGHIPLYFHNNGIAGDIAYGLLTEAPTFTLGSKVVAPMMESGLKTAGKVFNTGKYLIKDRYSFVEHPDSFTRGIGSESGLSDLTESGILRGNPKGTGMTPHQFYKVRDIGRDSKFWDPLREQHPDILNHYYNQNLTEEEWNALKSAAESLLPSNKSILVNRAPVNLKNKTYTDYLKNGEGHFQLTWDLYHPQEAGNPPAYFYNDGRNMFGDASYDYARSDYGVRLNNASEYHPYIPVGHIHNSVQDPVFITDPNLELFGKTASGKTIKLDKLTLRPLWQQDILDLFSGRKQQQALNEGVAQAFSEAGHPVTQHSYGQVKYYGPTMGKTTAVKTNQKLVDFDDIVREDIKLLAKEKGVSVRQLKTESGPEYIELLENAILKWKADPINEGKTLVVSNAALSNRPIFDNIPVIPSKEQFVARQVARGEMDPEYAALYYDALLKRNPELQVDDRFISDIESGTRSAKISESELAGNPKAERNAPKNKNREWLDWTDWKDYRVDEQPWTEIDEVELQSHFPEYKKIFFKSQKDGTFMKGFDGDPREWVMLLSENGQKLDPTLWFSGQPAGTNDITKPRILFATTDQPAAVEYKADGWRRTDPVEFKSVVLDPSAKGSLLQLRIPKLSKTYIYDAEGNPWHTLTIIPELEGKPIPGMMEYTQLKDKALLEDAGFPFYFRKDLPTFTNELHDGIYRLGYDNTIIKNVLDPNLIDEVIFGYGSPRVSVLGNNGKLSGVRHVYEKLGGKLNYFNYFK